VPSRIRPLSVVAALGVVVSIVMVVYGLSESTPAQQVALELSALPLSVSLAAGDVILLTTGSRQPGPRARMWWPAVPRSACSACC
jgi:hypothetical protein